MKAKIYYTIDLSVSWHTVCWIDLAGNRHNDKLDVQGDGVASHIDLVHKEFQRLHPGAVYETNNKLSERLDRIAVERALLESWNKRISWAPIRREQ